MFEVASMVFLLLVSPIIIWGIWSAVSAQLGMVVLVLVLFSDLAMVYAMYLAIKNRSLPKLVGGPSISLAGKKR
ncbi:MAG: hypothetical protein HY455_00260 [Parcubacteria group bacterium]|nr:hypothetical protein [Parcubacteria group bacterium]